jgi:hypothetical protein
MNNLCDTCVRIYSECMNKHDNLPTIEYGEQDSVLDCDWYIHKEKYDSKNNRSKI